MNKKVAATTGRAMTNQSVLTRPKLYAAATDKTFQSTTKKP